MSGKLMGVGRKHRGLSVLEVLVALSIITIAGLGIIATLTRAMVAQSSSSHQTVGRPIAESELQKAVLAGPPRWGTPGGDLSKVYKRNARVGQTGKKRQVEFSFQLEVTPVSQQNESGDEMFSNHADPGPYPTMGRLYEVKLKIWWNADQTAQGAVERGTQSLTVSKMVYIET